jgi:putative transposase
MKLVEIHNFKKNSKQYKELDEILFKSKNVYNSALYVWRQYYIKENKFISLNETYHIIKNYECYKQLPQNVSTQTLKLTFQNINSYFKAIKSYNKNPNKFLGKPKLPKYKDSIKGRIIAVYTSRVIRKKDFNKGKIQLTGLSFSIPTKIENYNDIKQVRIIPSINSIKIEIVYNKQEKKIKKNKKLAAIDLGLNNLSTLCFNEVKNKPIIINGKPLKSINQYYNKKKSKLQSKLHNNKRTSKNILKLTEKRNNKIKDYLHKSSRCLVNQLVSKNISKLIIGYNKGWKQDINIGKKNNQNFVNIPFLHYINQLKYKCELEGIEVILNEESYTSKCSFIDMEDVKKHDSYVGKRIKRGLFKSKGGILINADLNGSYNIMRKVVPNVFNKGIEGFVVSPKVISL